MISNKKEIWTEKTIQAKIFTEEIKRKVSNLTKENECYLQECVYNSTIELFILQHKAHSSDNLAILYHKKNSQITITLK